VTLLAARAQGDDGLPSGDDGLAFRPRPRPRAAETAKYPEGFGDIKTTGGVYPADQVSKYGELNFGDFGLPDHVPKAAYDLREAAPNCVKGDRVRNQVSAAVPFRRSRLCSARNTRLTPPAHPPACPPAQGQCGSCWSFATHTAWANQMCINAVPGSADAAKYAVDQSKCNNCDPSIGERIVLASRHPPCDGKDSDDDQSDANLYTCPGAVSTQYQVDCNKGAGMSACGGGTLISSWKWTMVNGGTPMRGPDFHLALSCSAPIATLHINENGVRKNDHTAPV
jgi:hypothetical protein